MELINEEQSDECCSNCSSLAVHLCSGDNCERVMCEDCIWEIGDLPYCEPCHDKVIKGIISFVEIIKTYDYSELEKKEESK